MDFLYIFSHTHILIMFLTGGSIFHNIPYII